MAERLTTAPALRRMTSTSSAVARRTTTFSDFLSDGEDDGSDDSDAHGQDEVGRMQQQADDMAYIDDSFGNAPRPQLISDSEEDSGSGSGSEDEQDLHARRATQSAAPRPSARASRSIRATVAKRAAVMGRATMALRATIKRRKSTKKKKKGKDALEVEVDELGVGSREEPSRLTRMDGVLLDSDEDGDGSERGRDADSDSGDSIRMDSPMRADEGVDDSFSSAMGRGDEDDDFYDDGGYDDEVAEQQQRTLVVEQIQQQEERRYSQRLSEEPFSEMARASAAVVLSPVEDTPFSSSIDSFSSASSASFFVESVRGSSDSIAPLMDLPTSNSLSSSSSSSSGVMARRSDVDLSFRTSFVPVTLSMPPSAAPVPLPAPVFTQPLSPLLGFRVVDHTQPQLQSPVLHLPLRDTVVYNRESSASSSSSSLSEASSGMEDMSFSSTIDDSFVERPRSSSASEENISFVVQKYPTTSLSGGLTPHGPQSPVDRSRASSASEENLSFVVQRHLGVSNEHAAAVPATQDDRPRSSSASDENLSFVVQRHLGDDQASATPTKDPVPVQQPRRSSASEENLSFVVQKPIQGENASPTTHAAVIVPADELKASEEPPSEELTSSGLSFFMKDSFNMGRPAVNADVKSPTLSPVVSVAVLPPPTALPAVAAPRMEPPKPTAADDSPVTRSTKKFSKPLPPGRRRGGPASAAAATAAAAAVNVSIASIPASLSASPPGPATGINTSIVSSRASDARLDFTGVFMGDAVDTQQSTLPQQSSSVAKSPEAVKMTSPQQSTSGVGMPSASLDDDATSDLPVAAFTAGPPSIRRMVSAQEASERKVEDFFRKTYLKDQDEDDSDFDFLLSSDARTSRRRAKTTATRAMAAPDDDDHVRADPLLTSAVSNRARRSSTSATKMVDLKSLRSGQRIEELLRANEEESKDDDLEFDEYVNRETAIRTRALSRPSARLPINEDLLEELFPLRPSTASSVAMASRQPPPACPEEPPLTPITVYSINSDSDDSSSIADSEIARPYQFPAAGNVIQRDFTLSIASQAVSASTRSSPNEIPMPPNYMLSPRLSSNGGRRPSSSLGSFSSSSAADSSAPTTPQLPTLTVKAREVIHGAGAATAAMSNKLASSGVQASPFASSSRLRSPPNPMAASTGPNNNVAPGFRWHPELSQNQQNNNNNNNNKQSTDAWSSEDGSLSIKESVWHAAGALSIGGGRASSMASVSNHLQRASTTFKNSFQRARNRFFPPNGATHNALEPTSPNSVCSAPPKLPRGFDDRRFYSRYGNIECGDNMIVVSKPGGGNSAKEAAMQHKHKTQAWLLLLGILFGVVVGLMLVHIDPIASNFKLLVDVETGEMTVPSTVKWMLVPGSLFLRCWNCVSMPLLFCHVVNGVAELAMTQKTDRALSFRTVLCLVATALLTTVQGVGLTVVYHKLGLFSNRQAGLATEAASVKTAVGVIDRVKGMAAMMCAGEETYLQSSQNGKLWRCSNETVPLPVHEGIVVNDAEWGGSSSAVFAFADVKKAYPVRGETTYYPTELSASSIGDLLSELTKQFVPSNAADSFSKALVPSLVGVGLLLGLACGLRAYHRSITAQHHLQQSIQSNHNHRQPPPKVAELAEAVLATPHPILGVIVELQQLLEWIVEILQRLAPVGVASLLAGHIALHRDEWVSVPGPIISLVVGVTLASLVHVLIVTPLVLKLVSGVNAYKSLPSFLAAYGLSFGTGNVALCVPQLAHSFASAQVVTKSMSQVGVAIATAALRSANGLYYPLAMLFLLESNLPTGAVVPLTTKMVLWLALLSFLSCFVALSAGMKLGLPGVGTSLHLRVILVLFRAWTSGQLSASGSLPLLVLADVVLGRVVAMVNSHDHVLFTRLLADHCAELCVEGTTSDGGVGASPVYL